MSKNEKLLQRLLSRPKDFTFDELRKLLGSLGCVEDTNGKTSGSRVAFYHTSTGFILKIHKPHPGNELKKYHINEVIKYLQRLEDAK